MWVLWQEARTEKGSCALQPADFLQRQEEGGSKPEEIYSGYSAAHQSCLQHCSSMTIAGATGYVQGLVLKENVGLEM